MDKDSSTCFQIPQEYECEPNFDDELKPKIGQVFDTLDEGKKNYEKYALSVGFSVRSASSTIDKKGVKRWKYFVCSKEGYLAKKKDDKEESESTVKARRRRDLTREGCNANVGFKWVGEGKYEIARFHESHTHPLASPMKRPFLRTARKVNPFHKSLLHACSRANIGPS
ncbi:putative protein FAR1-RELATED SEQUENCE 10 isoform X2 [Medicago truncatula]|uniref:putative protein FAR1-RELATED SEQUENCE 10 isoform X2 n=1 Tax=Medicago truncatula TaxID=3880 RepID=UPI0019678A61|nr:putative protein FAR1-RELATED SEQUENCE 10 isoform X2 [Medicago truncatula]